MATNNLLTQEAPDYRAFVDNQVLTDQQLNAVVNYLNFQDSLSRVLLSGVGIVCGLEISPEAGKNQVHLTNGAAVTTAGNLLKPGEKTYKGFKKFTDPNVKYPFFTDDDGNVMDLWELETDTEPSDVNELAQFENVTDFDLEEGVAILYLEDYLEEDEDCSPVDCDTQGRPVINRIRLLLVSQANAQRLVDQDSIFSGVMGQGSDPTDQQLPHMYASRVVLNAANTETFQKFKEAYTVQFDDLASKISDIGSLTLFKSVYEQAGIDPGNRLKNISQSYYNIQYLYDFYKDLVTAYNELRDLLKKNYSLCCPDPEAFPKHVMLGQLTGNHKSWRHRFYPSPILDEAKVGQRLRKSFLRLLGMIEEYHTESKQQIKITPSRGQDEVLGRRAIPYYYDLDRSPDAARFLSNWKEGDLELVPNFYKQSYPSNDFDPLDVCLDDHDFYRVEGHVGKNVRDVQESIQKMRDDKGLSFDVKPVAIGSLPDEDLIDYNKYRVYFEDLQVILQAWNEEQKCLMESASKFLTQFSLQNPGTHIKYSPAATINTNVSSGSSDTADNSGSTSGGSISGAEMFMEMQPMYMASSYTYGTGATKTKKSQENEVYNSIEKQEGTIGATLFENINASYGKDAIIYNGGKVLDEAVKDWENPDIVEATVNIPLELIGYLKETQDYKLTDIEDFTEENLKKYIDALKAQCQQTQLSKKRFQNLTSLRTSEIAQPWLEHYQYVLNRIISSCCLIEKVKVLYEKIIERKKELLEDLVLKNFIQKYPGAEHKAGVPDGGTLILLYYSRPPVQVQPVATLSEAQPVATIERDVSLSTSSSELTGTIINTGFERGTELFGRATLAPVFGRRLIPMQERIPNGTVIGDLCLPYICCSETPSTTFVFPEQLATLRLPVDHVCMEEDTEAELIPMTVTPTEGVVKAFIQNRELDGVIVVNENGTFFDPNKVSLDDYGVAIRFEVNGQPVEPIMEVLRKPQAGFTYAGQIAFRKENTVAVVTFENTSTPFEELSFRWNFAGDIVENETALKFTHIFAVQPGKNFDFTVELTASNGPCQDTFTDTVSIDVPPLEEEPDQPDEPTDNCVPQTAEALKGSTDVMEAELTENPDLLGELNEIYQNTVAPDYNKVLSNPPDYVGDGLTEEQVREVENIFLMIQNVQFKVQENVALSQENEGTDDPNVIIQQEFAIKLYLELMLFYFYLQSCRDDAIIVHANVSDIAGSWPSFVKKATGSFAAALSALLKEDDIHQKLVVIRKRMGSRFDETIRNLIDKIITMLGDFIGS